MPTAHLLTNCPEMIAHIISPVIQHVLGCKVRTSTTFMEGHYKLKTEKPFCQFSISKDLWTFEVGIGNSRKNKFTILQF